MGENNEFTFGRVLNNGPKNKQTITTIMVDIIAYIWDLALVASNIAHLDNDTQDGYDGKNAAKIFPAPYENNSF